MFKSTKKLHSRGRNPEPRIQRPKQQTSDSTLRARSYSPAVRKDHSIQTRVVYQKEIKKKSIPVENTKLYSNPNPNQNQSKGPDRGPQLPAANSNSSKRRLRNISVQVRQSRQKLDLNPIQEEEEDESLECNESDMQESQMGGSLDDSYNCLGSINEHLSDYEQQASQSLQIKEESLRPQFSSRETRNITMKLQKVEQLRKNVVAERELNELELKARISVKEFYAFVMKSLFVLMLIQLALCLNQEMLLPAQNQKNQDSLAQVQPQSSQEQPEKSVHPQWYINFVEAS